MFQTYAYYVLCRYAYAYVTYILVYLQQEIKSLFNEIGASEYENINPITPI